MYIQPNPAVGLFPTAATPSTQTPVVIDPLLLDQLTQQFNLEPIQVANLKVFLVVRHSPILVYYDLTLLRLQPAMVLSAVPTS